MLTAAIATCLALGKLLDDVRALVKKYVVLDELQADIIALWVAHTHVIHFFDCTPYLAIHSSTKRAGKTRLLEVLEAIVLSAWLTGRTTAAALARKVDRFQPTLLLDESDAAFGGDEEYSEMLRGLLNTGYRRSGKATVCVAGGQDFVDLSTFCPKAIAGIGRLPDTVQDRSIPIELRRRRKDEPCHRWREREGRAEAGPVRERLAAWAKTAATDLRTARPVLPDALGDRAQDVVEPLLVIADLAGGDWPERARRAAVALMGETLDEDSIGVQLLGDIRQVFADAGDPAELSSAKLRDGLVCMEDRPWPTWGRTGKPITPHAIARRLADFGVVGAGSMKVDGRVLRGYRRAAFEDAWSRYLPVDAAIPIIKALPRYRPADSLAESLEINPLPLSSGSGPKTLENSINIDSSSEVALSAPDVREGDEDGEF